MGVPGLSDLDANFVESTLASATTVDLGSVSTRGVVITGTTAITSFGSGKRKQRFIRFAGALTLTHNATSLILPGGASLVTAAGDTCIASSDGSGNWIVRAYQRTSGIALFTTYTPAVGSSGGSANVYGARTGRYRVQDKRVDLQLSVTVTMNNGSGILSADLPPGLPSNGFEWSLVGFDTGFTGNPIFGRIPPNATQVQIKLINGAYPAQSASVLNLSGFYETA